MIKRVMGPALLLVLLTGCAGTTSAGTTVTVQVPTTVFVTGTEPVATTEAAPTESSSEAQPTVASAASLPPRRIVDSLYLVLVR